MRALLLAQPHEPTDELLEALEDAEIHEVLRVQDWGAFLRIADSESPDVAVITRGSVSDGSALDSAHWALRGMSLPAFIAIFDDTPPEQISSVFPAVQMPFSSVEIMIAIEEAQETLAAELPPSTASFGGQPRTETTAENDVVPQELFAATEGAESIVSQAIHSIMGLEADLDTDVGAPQGAFSLADSFGSGFNRPPSDFKPTLETDAASRIDSTPTLETEATGRPDFKPTVEADVGSLFGPDDDYDSDVHDRFDEEPSSISLNAVPHEHSPFDELGSDTGFDELDAELMAELNRQPVRGPLDPPPHPDDSDYLPEMEAQDLIGDYAEDPAPADEEEPSADTQVEEVVVRYPDLRNGTLKETPLGVVFFALHVAEANGLLRVNKGQLSREIWVREGKLGRADRMPSTSDTEKLLGMFNWSDGVFSFDAEANVPNRIYRYEHPVELVYRGIAGHVGFNEVAVHFTPRFKQFIVRATTDLDPINVPAMRAVRPWLNSIEEPLAFEKVMATAGADTEQVLKHAFFSECCGLIAFVDDPAIAEVHLTFDTSAFASASAGSRSGGPPPSGQYAPPPSGQYSPPSGQFESPAARAAREEAELRKELEARAARLRRASSYEILGLEEGCGVKAVEAAYYQLVKKSHPDVYGVRSDPAIRKAAEQIFMSIQKAFTELRKTENEPRAPQTSTPPPRSRARVMSGENAAVQRGSSSPGTQGSGRGTSNPGTTQRPRPARSNPTSQPTPNKLRTPTPRPRPRRSAAGADQLLFSARRAMQQGVYDKALENVEAAKRKGATGFDLDSIEAILLYLNDAIDAPDARKRLNDARKLASGKLEQSRLSTYFGHLQRLDGDVESAARHYREALKLDPENRDAARWVRHYSRQNEKDKGGLFSKLFQGKNKK